jgi:hypothetical protein
MLADQPVEEGVRSSAGSRAGRPVAVWLSVVRASPSGTDLGDGAGRPIWEQKFSGRAARSMSGRLFGDGGARGAFGFMRRLAPIGVLVEQIDAAGKPHAIAAMIRWLR